MRVKPFRRAIGFVDWKTALIASGAEIRPRRPGTVAEIALRHVERIVSECLNSSAATWKFDVRLRLYAGVACRNDPYPYYHGITSVMRAYASKVRAYHDNSVVFRGGDGGIRLGNTLACVPRRRASKHDVHLLDTLRSREGRPEEKMVDTALVVDLLGLANRKEADRYLVVSDDDDMLPGVLAAEAVGADSMMLSRPEKSSRFMDHTSDLVETYQSVRA